MPGKKAEDTETRVEAMQQEMDEGKKPVEQQKPAEKPKPAKKPKPAEVPKPVEVQMIAEEQKPAEEYDPMKDLVPVTLFADEREYNKPAYAKVNGVGKLFQRGVPIMMPRPYYEVLKHQARQNVVVSRLEQKLHDLTDERMAGDGQTLAGVKPERVKHVAI